MVNIIEDWRSIPGFEGEYEASSQWVIRSLTRFHIINGIKKKWNGKIIKPWLDTYYKVLLHKNGIRHSDTVHRLIAKTFIPNIENKAEVNHLDGDKLNNHKDNLEWVTPLENTRHAIYVLKACKFGEDHPQAKINNEIVRYIRNILMDNPKIKRSKLASEIGISVANLNFIIAGKTWRNVK